MASPIPVYQQEFERQQRRAKAKEEYHRVNDEATQAFDVGTGESLIRAYGLRMKAMRLAAEAIDDPAQQVRASAQLQEAERQYFALRNETGSASPQQCRKCGQRPRPGKNRWCTRCIAASRRVDPPEPRPVESPEAPAAAPGARAPARGESPPRAAEIVAPTHSDAPLRRDKAMVPRLDGKLMYLAVLYDEHDTIYAQLVKGCRRSPRFCLTLLEKVLDRTHGKPRKHFIADPRPGAIFMRDDAPASSDTLEEVGDAALKSAVVDLAMRVRESGVLPVQPLAVLPPPQ